MNLGSNSLASSSCVARFGLAAATLQANEWTGQSRPMAPTAGRLNWLRAGRVLWAKVFALKACCWSVCLSCWRPAAKSLTSCLASAGLIGKLVLAAFGAAWRPRDQPGRARRARRDGAAIGPASPTDRQTDRATWRLRLRRRPASLPASQVQVCGREKQLWRSAAVDKS